MRGPFYKEGEGVTGEPNFLSAKPTLHTYTDEEGVTRTKILAHQSVEEDGDQA